MAITVLITLTTAGIDSGPFNLYSDVDSYTSAFATGIGRATLLAGYSSMVVPDGTTIIRLVSSGNCTNYLDLAVVATTTTTTTGLTTTTTTALTTTTTTGIAYNLALASPTCRLNNCGDNLICAVRYAISVDNAPVGSYLTVTYNSGNASVSIYDSSPISGILEYTEPDATGTVNFTIFLRDSGGSVLTSITQTLSHQAFWAFLSICSTCYYYDLTIAAEDVNSAVGNSDPSKNGVVFANYNDCNDVPQSTSFTLGGPFLNAICAIDTTPVILTYWQDNAEALAIASSATQTATQCS